MKARFTLAGLLVMAVTIMASTVLLPFATLADNPVRVEVVKTKDGWQLLRGGKPYFIKGVGGDASRALLVQFGGNSFRVA